MMAPYYESPEGTIYHGNVLSVLQNMPDESVHCVVTSPPYWGLRDYGNEPQIWDDCDCEHVWGDESLISSSPQRDSPGGFHNSDSRGLQKNTNGKAFEASQGQFCQQCGAWRGSLGLEPTVELFIQHMVQIFREVKRVLRKDGTLWLNMGDSYSTKPGGYFPCGDFDRPCRAEQWGPRGLHQTPNGIKPKNLIGIPWRLALALQSDGWYLRSAMPWVKRSAMPESCKDRPASALEYMFLLSKSQKYYFDMESIRKDFADERNGCAGKYKSSYTRKESGTSVQGQGGKTGFEKGWNENGAASGRNFRNTDLFYQSIEPPHGAIFCGDEMVGLDVNPQAMKDAHFATFPQKLIEPCILAGSPKNGTVLDPFLGSGTTAIVAHKHGRKFVGVELSKTYLDDIAIPRIKKVTQQLKLF